MTQNLALWITALGVLSIGAAFVFVALQASRPVPEPEAVELAASAGRARTWLLAFLVAAFVPITGLSLTRTPYGADDASADIPVVQVVGHQWYWQLDQSEVPAGRPVIFQVTSADVNHGFAIYDANLAIVGQTQAMPGYENHLMLTLEPGTYRVLCLEYCGLVHHQMMATFDAVVRTAGRE